MEATRLSNEYTHGDSRIPIEGKRKGRKEREGSRVSTIMTVY